MAYIIKDNLDELQWISLKRWWKRKKLLSESFITKVFSAWDYHFELNLFLLFHNARDLLCGSFIRFASVSIRSSVYSRFDHYRECGVTRISDRCQNWTFRSLSWIWQKTADDSLSSWVLSDHCLVISYTCVAQTLELVVRWMWTDVPHNVTLTKDCNKKIV